MEQLTSIVSSRGLLRSCHSHNKKPVSSSTAIDEDLLENHAHGRSVYVCTDAIQNFARNFFPKIDVPLVLVSGDGDTAVSQSLLDDSTVADMLQSPLLLAWFAQNLNANHPKISPLPIGLDYHTMWERPGAWGISAVSAIAQEHTLLNTLAASPPFGERYMNAYCNWRPVTGWGDREECYAKIDKSVCFFETGAVPRSSSWQRQSEFMYVVSPEGIGMDCHRTWEAIALGCIPIVKRSPISSLYEDLPVLVLDDWSELRSEKLQSALGQFVHNKFNFSKLFRQYWLDRINNKRMTFDLLKTRSDLRSVLSKMTG